MSATVNHVRFSCPGCGRSYRAPGRLQGRQITCANCKATVRVGGGALSGTSSALRRRRARLLGWLAIALGVVVLLWVLFLLTHHAHAVDPSLKVQAAQGLGR